MPDTVAVAMGELAETVREGLLALAVGAGLQVMQVMMAESVTAVCGPKGQHDAERKAVRHGTEDGSVTLGGRRVPVRRPRVRTADGTAEVAVPAYDLFASTELLGEMALQRMMAKLSTRRYSAGLEPVGTKVEAAARSTSKSAVSRRFVAATESALATMLAADLSELDLVAVMVDGVHFADHLCVVALGIGIDGTKHPLGVVEGDTENTTVVKDLLVGLRERGLDTTRPILCVLDGAKALVGAVKAVFDHPVVHRCQLHKVRNVESKLPKALASTVAKKMRAAYHDPDALGAEATLEALARSLEKKHPGAAGSLREGLFDTLTVSRLGVPPTLARTLRSTNAVESMIEICRDHSTNVKRWRDGQMALRWCAAGMGEASKQFRRVNGFLHLPALRCALEAHVNGAVAPECDDDEVAA
ncbi:MAG TPA: IS256 family transposase [Actinomycetes bacterium]|nr:IS256 family transposase [Actinomycetes bacterium]